MAAALWVVLRNRLTTGAYEASRLGELKGLADGVVEIQVQSIFSQ